MSSKHEWLEESEIQSATFLPALQSWLQENGAADGFGRVLDWGCGRGRSVLRLRDMGVEAWGVDIDPIVLSKAEIALARRGLENQKVLCTSEESARFSEGYFNFIFSEETLEHVGPLDTLARSCFRLTANGGYGAHSFPGSRRIVEPHLHIPLAHWVPSGWCRQILVAVAILLGGGPRPHWPETLGHRSAWTKARLYCRYLNEKTCYRDVEVIVDVFSHAGFDVTYQLSSDIPVWARLFPSGWRRNGFPAGNLILLVRKTFVAS